MQMPGCSQENSGGGGTPALPPPPPRLLAPTRSLSRANTCFILFANDLLCRWWGFCEEGGDVKTLQRFRDDLTSSTT